MSRWSDMKSDLVVAAVSASPLDADVLAPATVQAYWRAALLAIEGAEELSLAFMHTYLFVNLPTDSP